MRRLVVLVLVALLLGSCGGGESVEGAGLESEATGQSEAAGGGSAPAGTLVAALSAKPDQLDPHSTSAYASFQVLENVYDTLVVPNADTLEMEPSLATDWEVSDDNLTWTFHLRDDVKFHDGSDLDSADVVYSFNRIIDDELSASFRFANVKKISATDASTVEIKLSQPTPNLLDNVGSYKGVAILSEDAADEFDLKSEANGTGPFTLESSSADKIELKANPDYWGDPKPSIDGVEFRFISEPTTALTELQTGSVDWTDNIPPQQVEDLSGSDDVTLEQVPSVDYWYWTANFDRKPFGNPKVRQALSYAIDREAVTEAAKFGAATVNQTAIPEGSFWYYDYAPFSYDPEKAKQLLADAGVEDLSMELMVTDEYPETVTAAEVMASQLADVGIDASIKSETFATWLDREGKGDFDAFMLGWLGNIDPFAFYNAQHSCDGNNNFQHYCSTETDKLLAQAATETDKDQRKQLYDQAVKHIVDDASYMYLYNPDVVQAWKPRVSGFKTRADRAINFETVSLSD